MRGNILAVYARAEQKIAASFAPTVVHASFGRKGSFVMVHEDGYVDFAGLPPHISSKFAKAGRALPIDPQGGVGWRSLASMLGTT